MAEQQRFPWLCRGGDIEAIAIAIENGADVNEEDPAYGETGLILALHNNHNNVAQLLINLPRNDVNKVDRFGRCAAHLAAVLTGRAPQNVITGQAPIINSRSSDTDKTKPISWN